MRISLDVAFSSSGTFIGTFTSANCGNTLTHALAALINGIVRRIGQIAGAISPRIARFLAAHRGEQHSQGKPRSKSNQTSLHVMPPNRELRCTTPSQPQWYRCEI